MEDAVLDRIENGNLNGIGGENDGNIFGCNIRLRRLNDKTRRNRVKRINEARQGCVNVVKQEKRMILIRNLRGARE